MKLSDRYENLLKEMRWNNAYMILGLKYQYVGNQNNNATNCFSVAMCVGMVDMHTVYPFPCHLMLNIYDAHVEPHSVYMSQIGY